MRVWSFGFGAGRWDLGCRLAQDWTNPSKFRRAGPDSFWYWGYTRDGLDSGFRVYNRVLEVIGFRVLGLVIIICAGNGTGLLFLDHHRGSEFGDVHPYTKRVGGGSPLSLTRIGTCA